MRVAFVVQRYGTEVNGGAESLCRLVAEHLSGYFDIQVVTTTALEHLPWDNYYRPGESHVNGVPVLRFPLDSIRDHRSFDLKSRQIYGETHSYLDEIEWMRMLGPHSEGLLRYIATAGREFDAVVFFTYQYFTTVFGLPLVPERSALVPCAHDDPGIDLQIYRPVFHLPRRFFYNTDTERKMTEWRFGNGYIPSAVIGTGIDLPTSPPSAERFRARRAITGEFILWCGRIEPAKGLGELFDHFSRYKDSGHGGDLKLVLMGKAAMPIPDRPDIISLGFVSEEEKFDGIAASELVVIPSPYESLSMINLEAWLLGKPVLSNARCQVLMDNCVKSDGGLYYFTYEEFAIGLDLLLADPQLRQMLGEQGREYTEANYSWEAVERKYVEGIVEVACG